MAAESGAFRALGHPRADVAQFLAIVTGGGENENGPEPWGSGPSALGEKG